MQPRIFSYHNISTLGYALTSLPAVVFPIAPLIFLFRSPNAPPMEIVAVLGAMGAIGLYFTIKHLLTWANERIELTGDEIVWYDLLGRERVRSPVGGITPGSLAGNVAFTVGVNGAAPIQKAWRFATVAGEIRFRSIISNYSDLIHELERLNAMSPAQSESGGGFRLVANYHSWQMVVAALVGIALGVGTEFAAYSAVTSPRSSDQTLILLPIIFALAGVGCLCMFVFAVLTFVNERITITGDQIVWHDRFGQDRVRCTATDIVPGSYNEEVRTTSKGGTYYRYSVMTKMGPIKFDQNITNVDLLAERFQRMSEGWKNPTGQGSNAGWSSDPLNDPDQANIPIK